MYHRTVTEWTIQRHSKHWEPNTEWRQRPETHNTGTNPSVREDQVVPLSDKTCFYLLTFSWCKSTAHEYTKRRGLENLQIVSTNEEIKKTWTFTINVFFNIHVSKTHDIKHRHWYDIRITSTVWCHYDVKTYQAGHSKRCSWYCCPCVFKHKYINQKGWMKLSFYINKSIDGDML